MDNVCVGGTLQMANDMLALTPDLRNDHPCEYASGANQDPNTQLPPGHHMRNQGGKNGFQREDQGCVSRGGGELLCPHLRAKAKSCGNVENDVTGEDHSAVEAGEC